MHTRTTTSPQDQYCSWTFGSTRCNLVLLERPSYRPSYYFSTLASSSPSFSSSSSPSSSSSSPSSSSCFSTPSTQPIRQGSSEWSLRGNTFRFVSWTSSPGLADWNTDAFKPKYCTEARRKKASHGQYSFRARKYIHSAEGLDSVWLADLRFVLPGRNTNTCTPL